MSITQGIHIACDRCERSASYSDAGTAGKDGWFKVWSPRAEPLDDDDLSLRPPLEIVCRGCVTEGEQQQAADLLADMEQFVDDPLAMEFVTRHRQWAGGDC